MPVSSTKSAVLVAVGFVGAFGAGFWTGLQNGSEPTPPPAKLASEAPVSPEAATLAALEKELAVERTARARAQAACETAEKELARVKTLAPASPVEATTGAAGAPASSTSETAHAAKGDLASKVRSLEAEADAAVRSKSMKKIAEVLKEAVKLERRGATAYAAAGPDSPNRVENRRTAMECLKSARDIYVAAQAEDPNSKDLDDRLKHVMQMLAQLKKDSGIGGK